ncbi:NADPH:quinone oxidoreductase family protein [Pseudooceanicola nanhaiensis]|uniref:NADPH:quinone oxidoreductase family protein n=1 Tax=Pseudooceanicola nanhaiensis TaxID=375761 RepID=UPI001CD5DB25|nr:NADPH:quinone oxidoreductase family protein [Pseudooceanicola nanhaiensis]MCA0918977.1 NADPH:quinone oxidoreductase family protein [Pseudooceanicola nanhaiensis]
MKSLQITSFGAGPVWTDTPIPEPGPGEILVRIKACGLNFADTLMIDGKYQDMPALPFTMGMEVSGTVIKSGPDTSAPPDGTRVAIFGGSGGLAEYGCFAVDRAVPLPETMSFEDAAALQIAYGTSHVALAHKARLAPGETLLVLGAAGGVGLTAVEIGKLMGARVIACARGADKLEIARKAGADHLIDSGTQDLRDEVKALGGADVVYDPVGGDLFTAAFRACKPEARILLIGFASGTLPEVKPNHMLVKNIDLMGFYWGGYLKFRPEVLTESLAKLVAWHQEGKIRPHISHLLPLDRAEEGLELLRSRRSTGKVVITI